MLLEWLSDSVIVILLHETRTQKQESFDSSGVILASQLGQIVSKSG